MKIFNSQVELTAYWEGFKANAYQDVGGIWTLGYGFTTWNGEPVVEGMSCTEIVALNELSKIINHLMIILSSAFETENLNMIYPIVDYGFNVGLGGYPKLRNNMRKKEYSFASHEFLNGFYVKGVPIEGLLLRRISEFNTFTSGSYVAYEKGDQIDPKVISLLNLMNTNPAGLKMINNLKGD